MAQEEGFGGGGAHWSSGSEDNWACSLLKERRLKNKKAEREDRKREMALVVWRDEMICKRELKGVTENQSTIKATEEDKDVHVREA